MSAYTGQPDDNGNAHPGSFHTIPFPPEVAFSYVSCYSSRGDVHVAVGAGDTIERHVFRPTSPTYDVMNPGSGGNVIIPVGKGKGKAVQVAITFFNDSLEAGEISVIAGLSVAVEANQNKLFIKRPLASKEGSTVAIVFTSP